MFSNQRETAERHTPNDDYENFLTIHYTADCTYYKPRAKGKVLWESKAVKKKC